MTQGTATNFVEEAVTAWDLYCAGDYGKILQQYGSHDNSEVRDIRMLAGMEVDETLRGPVDIQSASLFTPLLQGMQAYHQGDFKSSSERLGNWLLGKSYYTNEILERFTDAASKSRNYPILFSVAKKYLDSKNHQAIMAGPLFDATCAMGKHQETVALWKKFNTHLNEPNRVQRVAFSMIQLGQYGDAEKILLDAYERIHGSPYKMDYEATIKKYSVSIKNIPELEKKAGTGDFETGWELGMAYIFNRQYDKAARVLESLKSRAS